MADVDDLKVKLNKRIRGADGRQEVEKSNENLLSRRKMYEIPCYLSRRTFLSKPIEFDSCRRQLTEVTNIIRNVHNIHPLRNMRLFCTNWVLWSGWIREKNAQQMKWNENKNNTGTNIQKKKHEKLIKETIKSASIENQE